VDQRNYNGFERLGARNKSDGGFKSRRWFVRQRFEFERFGEGCGEKKNRVPSQRLTQTNTFP
jgi:hypothetical protein